MKRRFRWFTSLSLCLVTLSATQVTFADNKAPEVKTADSSIVDAAYAAPLEKIAASLENKRKEQGVTGCSLLIVKDDKVIFSRGFGLRDVQKSLPVTPNTLFFIGSMTKAFTAMLAEMCIDERKMKLEDSPHRYLPYFRMRDPAANSYVSILDLLCHCSGVKRTDLVWQIGTLGREDVIRAMGEAQATARYHQIFQYNNVGYSTVGEVIAKVQGTSWEEVVTKRLFEPLGMKDTTLSLPKMLASPDFSYSYAVHPTTKAAFLQPTVDLTNVAAAGAIKSNATDMAQWLRFMLNGGVRDGKRLVSERGYNELLIDEIKVSSRRNYGLGWFLQQWDGHQVVAHGGEFNHYHSEIAFMPDQHLGFVMLSNATSQPFYGAVGDIVWTNLVGPPTKTDNKETTTPGDETPAEEGTAFPAPVTSIAMQATPAKPALGPVFPPISLDQLMENVIEAAGGEEALHKHPLRVTTFDANFENEGATAQGTFISKFPDRDATNLTLSAVGKQIGQVHEYSQRLPDGSVKASVNISWERYPFAIRNQTVDYASLSAIQQMLEWKTLYKSVSIKGTKRVGDEMAYVVEKTPEKGTAITDYISTNSFLLLKRDSPLSGWVRGKETYSDYRNVDGVMVPYRVEVQSSALGHILLLVKDVSFNQEVPDSEFGPKDLKAH